MATPRKQTNKVFLNDIFLKLKRELGRTPTIKEVQEAYNKAYGQAQKEDYD